MKKIIILVLLISNLTLTFSNQCGDVNSDNMVNIVDALLIAKNYVAPDSVTINIKLADVNSDKSINIIDALLIAQFYVGIIDSISCDNANVPPPPDQYGSGYSKPWHKSGGFGTDTKGGLYGEVYKVTNLNNSGSGSFREAVSEGNRFVVFEVGGVIDLKEDTINIRDSHITVAGETAPSPGISFIRGNFTARGNNIVISHINVMLGTISLEEDTANIHGENVVFNHVSTFWARDEVLSIHKVNNVTLYKCIIAEGLQYSGHEDGEHSKGSLINGNPQKLSLIGNLYAHNALRNPRVDTGEIFIANQVVYNWAPGWDHAGPKWSPETGPTKEAFNLVISARRDCKVSLVGSVAIQGPESIGEYFLAGHYGKSSSAQAYVNDNIIINQQGKNLNIVDTATIDKLSAPPIWPDGFKPLSADEALYEALRTVGSRPGERDIHNKRLVQTVVDGKGRLIDSQDEVGGYPITSRTRHSISVPSSAQARQDWLDSLENKISIDTKIDLSRLYQLVGSRASDIYRL